MRRGMCAQREGGLEVTTDSTLSLKTHPCSHTYTHYLFLNQQRAVFILSGLQKGKAEIKVWTLKITFELQSATGDVTQ